MSDDLILKIESLDDTAESREIHQKLSQHVESEVGPADRQPFTAVFRNKSGEIQAGLRGFSHWSWFYISHLWIAPELRGQGAGSKLIEEVEKEAKNRGCLGLYVDTFSPQALDFYFKNGFENMGKIEEFAAGKTRYYLTKRLARDP